MKEEDSHYEIAKQIVDSWPDWIRNMVKVVIKKEYKKDCSVYHKLFRDKDALCPICNKPLNPNF